eukprot:845833-Pelagomonas_calceolata.AAC.3
MQTMGQDQGHSHDQAGPVGTRGSAVISMHSKSDHRVRSACSEVVHFPGPRMSNADLHDGLYMAFSTRKAFIGRYAQGPVEVKTMDWLPTTAA